jgi:hypothetical protein
MTNIKYGLFDDFELMGNWWLPNKYDNKVSGLLKFNNNDKITLDLIGSLREIMFPCNDFFEAEIILGVTNDGKLCTLFKNYEIKVEMNISIPGLARTIFESKYLFVGKHFDRPEDICFSALQINFTNIESWMAQNPFKVDMLKNGRSVFYGFPDDFETELENPPVKIKSTFEFNSSGENFKNMEWKHTAFIKIVYKSNTPSADEMNHYLQEELQDYGGPYSCSFFTDSIFDNFMSFEKYWKFLYDINNLLTLLIGETTYPKKIKAFGYDIEFDKGTKWKETIDVFFAQKKPGLKENISPYKMIIPLPRIRNKISEIIHLWFLKSEKLRSVYDLFFGTFYNPTMYFQFHFLSLMQALESFHRVTKKGKYLEGIEWEPHKKTLIDSIPQELDSDFKASLKSRIRYGNEYSLRKRMKDLVSCLDKTTQNTLLPTANYFSGKLVDTRNYFTHYDEDLKDEALEGAELFYANQRLKIFLTLLLLKEVGIQDEIAIQLLMDSGRYQNVLNNTL